MPGCAGGGLICVYRAGFSISVRFLRTTLRVWEDRAEVAVLDRRTRVLETKVTPCSVFSDLLAVAVGASEGAAGVLL